MPTPEELRAKAEKVFDAQHPRRRQTGLHRPANGDENLLASMPIGRGRVLTVSVSQRRPDREGRRVYAVKQWNVDQDGLFYSTPVGVTASADQLPYLAELVAKALDHELCALPDWADGTSPPAGFNGAGPSTAPPADTEEA